MRLRAVLAGLASIAALCSAPSYAQVAGATVVSGATCPSSTVLNVGNNRPLVETQQGALCTNATGGGGGGNVTITGPLGTGAPAVGVTTTLDTTDAAALQSIVTNTTGGGNAAASATGSAVPAKADYEGLSNAGTLIGAIGDASGRAIVAGAGTAGSASGGVLTIQGVASMTPILATVTATNLSTNEAQINGVTPLMGAGATGAGSQRVTAAQDTTTIAGSAPGTAGAASANVITVQGVASMTKLLVTPDSVALPANQSVNVAQVNGVTTLTGTGAQGTGAQRVTVATDSATVAGSASIPAGANLMGKVGIDQTTVGTTNAVSLAQVGANTVLTGNGVSGTGSQRVNIASDNTAFAVNIQAAGSATAVGNGTNGSALRVTVASDSTGTIATTNAGTFAVQAQPTPVTTGGLSSFVLEPAASDNHTVIKNGAGQVYSIVAFNNSATVNYIRLYNVGTGFNGCNSATSLLWEGHIPASTSDAGFVIDFSSGIAFATGISICVTSGYGQTNTTSATATAMSIDVLYK
jgi:hypothetical protein